VVKETVVVEVTAEVTHAPTRAAPTQEPGAEPTPFPPTLVSPGVVVQRELDKLVPGLIAYNPPTRMTVDEPERVEVRVSMDVSAPITAALKGVGAPTVESIPVSYWMKVRLVGDTFDILALSSEEQVVPDRGFAEWDWNVTPTKSGQRMLSLIVTALVKAQGAEGTKDLPIIEREIHVDVTAGSMFGAFFRDNRGWVYPAVLVPLAAALVRWLWQRQQKRKQPAGPGTGGEAVERR
jgi:hypothetical protein